jgi:hypothetical protein
VTVRSANGQITVPLASDASLRTDTVAIFHGFADTSVEGRSTSAAVTRLVGMDESDPITGIPRMSAIPVSVCRAGDARQRCIDCGEAATMNFSDDRIATMSAAGKGVQR